MIEDAVDFLGSEFDEIFGGYVYSTLKELKSEDDAELLKLVSFDKAEGHIWLEEYNCRLMEKIREGMINALESFEEQDD